MTPDPKITLVKTLLAIILGPAVVAGAWVFNDPDGNNFVGVIRDNIRVARVAEQITTLTIAVRRHFDNPPYYGPILTDLTPALLRSRSIPIKMIDATVLPPVIRSPWGTKILLQSERHSFSITVPVSSYGCYKLLLTLGRASIVGAYANGVQQKLPISSKSDIQGCTPNAINVVKFSFS